MTAEFLYNSWKIPIWIPIEKLDGFTNIEITTVSISFKNSIPLEYFPLFFPLAAQLFDYFEVLWLQKKLFPRKRIKGNKLIYTDEKRSKRLLNEWYDFHRLNFVFV